MAILPAAYAASLLRQDDAGRRLFFPDSQDKGGYVVPDGETEQRILGGLKRIRLAQLAGWVLFPVVVIALIVATDGLLIPKWLFFLGLVTLALAIQLIPEWARYRLGRGLVWQDAPPEAASLLDRLPGWAVATLIVLALGVAIYIGSTLPLEAVTWVDDIAHFLAGSKAVAIVIGAVGGMAAVLWGGITAVKRWFQP